MTLSSNALSMFEYQLENSFKKIDDLIIFLKGKKIIPPANAKDDKLKVQKSDNSTQTNSTKFNLKVASSGSLTISNTSNMAFKKVKILERSGISSDSQSNMEEIKEWINYTNTEIEILKATVEQIENTIGNCNTEFNQAFTKLTEIIGQKQSSPLQTVQLINNFKQ
jgi:hypothetical protein